MRRLSDRFDVLDRDGNKSIEKAELSEILEKIRPNEPKLSSPMLADHTSSGSESDASASDATFDSDSETVSTSGSAA